MYELILWMCLKTSPDCPLWNAVNHIVTVHKMDSMKDCEDAWAASLKVPDPDDMKSYHICQPITESL